MPKYNLQKNKKDVPIYRVDWVDATTDHRWRFLDDIEEDYPIEITSIGYLLSKNEDQVVLLQSWSEHGKGSCSLTIPRKWITRMKKIA